MKISSFIALFLFSCTVLQAQDLLNDAKAVSLSLLQQQKQARVALANTSSNHYTVLKQLLELGEWELVLSHSKVGPNLTTLEVADLLARYYWLNNDFQKTERIIKALTPKEQQALPIQRIQALLKIEAWDLQGAEMQCKLLLQQEPNAIETSVLLGRALMLQKKYTETLALAEDLILKNPKDAAGYFLKADVFFWDQNAKEAEEFLIKGLQLNPYHADARFYYGYAIWRRFDATQLDAMMAQWELALQLNPLHYQTHWHLGNGHTNLTFADYADADEKAIRAELEEADALFTANQLEQALIVIDKTSAKYKSSVLPVMHKGSLLYSDFDALNRKEGLDEAESLFLSILARKSHYGPAHNGLSAVIKSKRLPFLKDYSATMQDLRNPKIDNMADFLEIFPDVAYYPGNVAKGMAWNQLYTSTVYFPFLVKQHRLFVIPPLHVDLALAMKAPYFRFNATFDNRQWMDIRGVGSGAAAIEYVERGAFQERNVLLHEYVHLFHGQVLTDAQNRRIKALYYQAMQKGLTLDYYSQNNESEYLAQTYPAYFELVKVHPLDFKSMNTLADLRIKDPDMFDFLDELIGNEKAYLAGNKEAMASNWAQVYLNLAKNAAKNDLKEANRLLDTALQYDQAYLPAHLAYAQHMIAAADYKNAHARLAIAKAIDSRYAPIYTVEAELIQASEPQNREQQAALYKKAYELEEDYMIKAQNSAMLRNFYFQQGSLGEALAVAKEYVQNGSEISTYLRDQKDNAKAFYAWQTALLGDSNPLEELAYLVSQKPQNYSIRSWYVEALLANGQQEEALRNLHQVYRNLQASQVSRPDFELLLAEAYALKGDKKELQTYLTKLTAADLETSRLEPLYNLRLVRLLLANGQQAAAKRLYTKLDADKSIFYRSADLLTQAAFAAQAGNKAKQLTLLKESLGIYPYQMEALSALKQLAVTDKKVAAFLTKHIQEMSVQPVL